MTLSYRVGGFAAAALAASLSEPYIGRDAGIPAGKRTRKSDPKKRAKRKAQSRARHVTRNQKR